MIQNVNSRDVSNINIKSLLTNNAYKVYEKELTTHRIQEIMLISFDFFVFNNLIVWGKYDIKVHNDTMPNNIFPNICFTFFFYYDNDIRNVYILSM